MYALQLSREMMDHQPGVNSRGPVLVPPLPGPAEDRQPGHLFSCPAEGVVSSPSWHCGHCFSSPSLILQWPPAYLEPDKVLRVWQIGIFSLNPPLLTT